MHIDIQATLRERLPGKSRLIPRFAVRWLERYVCQERLNEILDAIGDNEGVEAAAISLWELGITVEAKGLEQLPTEGRYVFASNHPLGGLDGLALIKLLGERYDGEVRFLVNDLLMAVKPLEPIFLPINKYGKQSRQAAIAIERELRSDRQILTFPAGLCSRRQSGKVADLPWQKSVVAMAVRAKRDIVPIFFDEENSRAFYRNANWRKRLGIKFNAEMLMLPREMVKKQGSTLHLVVGQPVAWDTLDAAHPVEEAVRLRQLVYSLKETL